MILMLIYIALGYWATGKIIYTNYIMIGAWTDIFMKRCCMGAILGWALIPAAIIKSLH